MNGFLGKVARLAASKAAAFSYAVAVGVAGNLIFHFVQPQVPLPAILAPASTDPALPLAKPQLPEPAATALIAPKPSPAPLPETPVAPSPAAVASPAPPAPPPKPALAAQPPEPRAPSQPDITALPAPSWKPLTLPGGPAPSEAAVKPAGVPAEPVPPATAALPPLGPPIEVSTPPTPPERIAAPPTQAAAPPPGHPTDSASPARSLELSDMWHPYRVVKKGLNWAGDQVTVITGDGAEEQPAKRQSETVPIVAHKPAAPADPIPLLPAKPELADAPAAAVKPAPGPGSGGLY
ncbi:MAG TPA: hypothetical protein VF007_11215 [Stellaceae bacterium]